MTMIERVERVARIVLWLALAAAVSIAPVSYIRARAAEAELEQAEKQAERASEQAKEAAEKAEKADAEKRLTLASMGQWLMGLNTTTALGSVLFTNASARRGAVCVEGVAENQSTHLSTTSLVVCKEVGPYDSAVHLEIPFAGDPLRTICPSQNACTITIKDLPISTPPATTATPPAPRPSAATSATSK